MLYIKMKMAHIMRDQPVIN